MFTFPQLKNFKDEETFFIGWRDKLKKELLVSSCSFYYYQDETQVLLPFNLGNWKEKLDQEVPFYLSQSEWSKYQKTSFYEEKGKVVFPLCLQEKKIGMIILEIPSQSEWWHLSEHEKLNLSETLKLAFYNLILKREMENKIDKITAVYNISKNVSHTLNLEDSLLHFFNLIQKVLETEAIFFYLYNESDKALILKSRWGNTNRDYFPTRIKEDDETVLSEVLKSGKPLLTHLEDLKSFIAMPVYVNEDRLIGIIATGTTKSYAYTEDDVMALKLLSYQLATIDLLKTTVKQMQTLNDYILNSLTSGIISVDNRERIERWNETAKEIFPFLSTTHIGKPFSLVFEKYPSIVDFFICTSGRFENKEIVIEKGGKELTLLLNVFPLYDNKGDLLGKAVFFKDITDIKELKQQLFRAEKFSTLGKVAAGIAHEIRNPLSGIRMIIQLLEEEFPPNHGQEKHFEILFSEIDRLVNLVNEMLAYARPNNPKFEIIDLKNFLEQFYFLLEEKLKEEKITLEINLPSEDKIFIKADSNQLSQIFHNLVHNSLEAIKLKRKDYPFFQGNIKITLQPSADEVVIDVRDNGIGIEEELLDKIFIPFFTQKTKGTGLGLSITQRLVEDNGGKIEVESVPQMGATFRLTFQRWKEKVDG